MILLLLIIAFFPPKDFYSTRNPFLDLYPKVKLYERLKELYVYTAVPETLLGEERLNFSLNVAKERSQLLDQLGDIFEHLDSKGTLEDYKGIGIKYLVRPHNGQPKNSFNS